MKKGIKEVIQSGDYVVLDTETTSKYPNQAEAIEIAIVDSLGNILFNSLIKPKTTITKSSIEVHGITFGELKNAPTIQEVYDELSKVLIGRNVLIYNDFFDTNVLRNSCQNNGVEPIVFQSYCVMKEYKILNNLRNSASLKEASGNSTSHRALEDCLDTLKVVEQIRKGETKLKDINKQTNDTKLKKKKEKINKSNKKETFMVSFEMYKEGLNIPEICEKRGLTQTTIEGHLLKAKYKGMDANIEVFIDPIFEEKILKVVGEMGYEKLSQLKMVLPDEVSYTNIKAVILKHKNVLIS